VLRCAALEKAVYPLIVEQEGGRKQLDPSSHLATSSCLQLRVNLPSDAPPAQLHACGGGSSQAEEVPLEQLPQRLAAQQHVPAAAVLAQLRKLAEAASYQLHTGRINLFPLGASSRPAARSASGRGHQHQQQEYSGPGTVYLAFLTWAAEGPGGAGDTVAGAQLRIAHAVLAKLDTIAKRIQESSDC
jgi:hypothetical protein